MISTKLAYFGRQLLAYDQIEQKNKELEVKSKEKLFKRGCMLIDPDTFFKKAWDFGIIIILFYTATWAPFKTAFLEDINEGPVVVFEMIVDIMFGLDILFTFFTPYKRFNGSMESRHK
jgi:hypothetical protein